MKKTVLGSLDIIKRSQKARIVTMPDDELRTYRNSLIANHKYTLASYVSRVLILRDYAKKK